MMKDKMGDDIVDVFIDCHLMWLSNKTCITND